MNVQGRVGPVNSADGASADARFGNHNEAIVSQLGAAYYELVKRGNVFTAALQAGVALSTLSATCTGFCLTNPLGSGKNLILLDVCVAIAAAPAGAAPIGLAANVNQLASAVTQTTPLTVRNCLLGSAKAGVGLAASATTLPAAPVMIRAIGGSPIAASAIDGPFIRDNVNGSIVLGPNTAISLSYITTAVTVLASMTWAEEDIPVTVQGV